MTATREEQLKETLVRIENYLPGWAGFIEAEYRIDSDFQALCEDFLVCALAREKWEQSGEPNATERRREYAEWLEELIQEIKNWLEQSANASRAV